MYRVELVYKDNGQKEIIWASSDEILIQLINEQSVYNYIVTSVERNGMF